MTERADFSERDRRYLAVRNAMAQFPLDALIVAGHGSGFNRGNLRYLADVHMWEGDGLILIPLNGEPMHVQVTYASSSLPDCLWVEDFRREPDPQDAIIDAIREKGLTNGTIGIAGYKKIITVGALEKLTTAFPNAKFKDADMLLDKIRAVKSELEILQLKELWFMSQHAIERFVDVARPGVSQREAASESSKVFRNAGSFTDLTVIQEGNFKGLPRDVSLKCDDWISFHLEICGETGHWSEINVVCAFKEPDKLEEKLIASEFRALQEIKKMAKPGVTLEDMEKTFLEVIRGDGWGLGQPEWHYSFHGQGMDGIEWPYFTPMLRGNADTVLEEGMVFSYHPHRATVPGVRRPPKIFDGLLITAKGAESLTTNWDFLWRKKW